MQPNISIQQDPFDIVHCLKSLKEQDHRSGACVTFTGTVRDLHGNLETMTLEHFPGMTEAEIKRIAEQAQSRWSINSMTIIHRYGPLEPGDDIVFVGVTSAHRGDAFDAARYIMDQLKTRAPFWKKEKDSGGEHWVDAKESDDLAAMSWKEK